MTTQKSIATLRTGLGCSLGEFLVRLFLCKLFCAVCFSSLIISTSDLADARPGKTFSKSEAQEELKKVYNLIVQLQPNYNKHILPKTFRNLYRELSDSFTADTKFSDLFSAITRLTAAVCDEHTGVSVPKSYFIRYHQDWPWHKAVLSIRDGDLFFQDQLASRSFKVLRINEKTGSEIAEYLSSRLPFDGCYENGTIFLNHHLPYASQLFLNLMGKQGKFRVEMAWHDGNKRTVELSRPPVRDQAREKSAVQRYANYKFHSQIERAGLELVSGEGFTHNKYFAYLYSEKTNIAYIRVFSFLKRHIRDGTIENVMRDIIKKKPDHLIIDLIDNPGGHNYEAQRLIAFLMPRSHRLWDKVYVSNTSTKMPENFVPDEDLDQKGWRKDLRLFRKIKKKGGIRKANVRKKSFGFPDYKGKIWIMVGPHTRSAATSTAAFLGLNRNAEVVGFVSDNNVKTSCFAAEGHYRLEHSGLLLSVPRMCTERTHKSLRKSPDLMIDHPVEMNAKLSALYDAQILSKTLDMIGIDPE